jgi:putative tryptophan/tyrosine transport system substrate-binding protein
MRRRVLLASMGASTLSPFVAFAQQQAMPAVGYLHSSGSDAFTQAVAAFFRAGLQEAGFTEGRNVALEFAWADGHYDRLPALADGLVRQPVSVIYAASLPSTLAARAATSTIPIVFVMGADPVALKILDSLNRPGGNLTGVCQLYGMLGAKRLEILRELAPGAGMIAILSNPQNTNAPLHLAEIQQAADKLGQKIEVFTASRAEEIDSAYAKLVHNGAVAVLVADDPFLTLRRAQQVELAARYRLPAIYASSDYVDAGGLATYGSDIRDNARLAGGYVGRILKGAKPAELPVLQPTKFKLVLNLKAAKVIGLTIPPALLAAADEVIE